MVMPTGVLSLLYSKFEASTTRLSLIRRGLGRLACVLYLPRRRQSRTECGFMSVFTLVMIEIDPLRSDLQRSGLGVPLGHSLRPNVMTLNLRSPGRIPLGGLDRPVLDTVGICVTDC